MPRKKHPPEQGNPVQSGSLLDRDGLISSAELAVFLGKKISTLDAWACRGGGPAFIKVGRDRMYAPADVREYLRENRHEDRQEPAA